MKRIWSSGRTSGGRATRAPEGQMFRIDWFGGILMFAFILAVVAGVASGLSFFMLADVGEGFQRVNTLLESHAPGDR